MHVCEFNHHGNHTVFVVYSHTVLVVCSCDPLFAFSFSMPYSLALYSWIVYVCF